MPLKISDEGGPRWIRWETVIDFSIKGSVKKKGFHDSNDFNENVENSQFLDKNFV